jgi:hypothetical protein
MKQILKAFDLFEDRVRARLSRHPLVYGVVSGIGIVMFYRGLWMVLDNYAFFTGPTTLLIATVILFSSGVFVSQFVSNHIILSGIKREKKMVEKVGEQIKTETDTHKEIIERLEKIESSIKELKITRQI